MATRLYLIRPTNDPGALGRLVEAKHPSQALRHVAANEFRIELPSSLEAARLGRLGVDIERADEAPNAVPEPSAPLSEPPL